MDTIRAAVSQRGRDPHVAQLWRVQRTVQDSVGPQLWEHHIRCWEPPRWPPPIKKHRIPSRARCSTACSWIMWRWRRFRRNFTEERKVRDTVRKMKAMVGKEANRTMCVKCKQILNKPNDWSVKYLLLVILLLQRSSEETSVKAALIRPLQVEFVSTQTSSLTSEALGSAQGEIIHLWLI